MILLDAKQLKEFIKKEREIARDEKKYPNELDYQYASGKEEAYNSVLEWIQKAEKDA